MLPSRRASLPIGSYPRRDGQAELIWMVGYIYGDKLKKSEHLYSALHGTNHSKALRHGSQFLTCEEHHACLYLVSVHQMAPPLNVVVNI